jgi:hypothetical protein
MEVKVPWKSFWSAAIAAAIFGNAAPAFAEDDALPACDAAEVKQLAVEQVSLQKWGVINQTFINVFQIARGEAIGVNRNNGMKFCKAYFTCDLNKAKAFEKSLMGEHPMSAACKAFQFMEEADNPAWIEFSIQASGDGRYIVIFVRM